MWINKQPRDPKKQRWVPLSSISEIKSQKLVQTIADRQSGNSINSIEFKHTKGSADEPVEVIDVTVPSSVSEKKIVLRRWRNNQHFSSKELRQQKNRSYPKKWILKFIESESLINNGKMN